MRRRTVSGATYIQVASCPFCDFPDIKPESPFENLASKLHLIRAEPHIRVAANYYLAAKSLRKLAMGGKCGHSPTASRARNPSTSVSRCSEPQRRKYRLPEVDSGRGARVRLWRIAGLWAIRQRQGSSGLAGVGSNGGRLRQSGWDGHGQAGHPRLRKRPYPALNAHRLAHGAPRPMRSVGLV